MKLVLGMDDGYKIYLKTRNDFFEYQTLEEMGRVLFDWQVEFVWYGCVIIIKNKKIKQRFRFTAIPIDQKAKLIGLFWKDF